MTRIFVWVAATVAVVSLLFGYPTSTSSTTPSGTAEPVSGSAGSTRAAGPRPGAGATTRTWNGDTVPTQWGPVQVQITVAGDQITDVSVLQYPDANEQDRQISAYALPQLIDETLRTQGAGIDMVSGASYTSQGYIGSLQSALDQAGL